MSERKVDEPTGVETTGHEWDGIRELDNPLPRWWLFILWGSVAVAIAYWVLMPAWPGLHGYTKGLLGQSDRAHVATELKGLHEFRASQAAGMKTASLEQIEADPKLQAYALAQGQSVFGDNCATCHGVGGVGGKGYANLRDDVWLWGGSLEDIQHTITVGVRTGQPGARESQMPAFGRDGILKRDEIAAVANHVRALAGLPTDAKADLARGRQIFADTCAACHGPQGKGNQEMGAPNLTDAITLYGMDLPTITETITNGRGGVMPAWGPRLDPTTIKALTVYVHSLGGGQ